MSIDSLLYPVLQRTGLLGLCRRRFGGMGCILGFHDIVPRLHEEYLHPLRCLENRAESLAALLRHMQNDGYTFIPVDALPAALHAPSERIACLTFDDGYRSMADQVLPICQALKVPFTVYLPTGIIDRKVPAWWIALHELVLREGPLRVELDGDEQTLPNSSRAEKEASYARLAHCLMHLPHARRSAILTNWCAANGVDAMRSCDSFMTWEQIRQLNQDPLVTFGAHTVSHANLKEESTAELAAELAHSRERMVAELGACDHLAYPYGGPGEAGPREFAAAADAGFVTAVTTRWSPLFPPHRDTLHALPRLWLMSGDEGIERFTLRQLSGLSLALRQRGRRHHLSD